MSLVGPLLLATFLFCLGVYGLIARRNAVLVLISVELMLNAVNINLVRVPEPAVPGRGSRLGSDLRAVHHRRRRRRGRRRSGHRLQPLPQPGIGRRRRRRSHALVGGRPVSTMIEYAWLVPVLPLLSAVAIAAFGKSLPGKGSELGILSLAVAFVLSVAIAMATFTDASVEAYEAAFAWSPLGGGFVFELGTARRRPDRDDAAAGDHRVADGPHLLHAST
jgi:hypothetical protein